MTKEIVIEEAVVNRFEELGWWEGKMVKAGTKGSPDRWFVRKGFWVLVEFKRPGESPDGLQRRFHRQLREHGQTVYVIDNIADGYALAARMTEESDRRARGH